MNQYEMKQIAYQSTLKSRALQVLVYLIDRSNKEGTCYPAISTMSRELHISVSTVKRALRELTESGFVKKENRFREKNNGQTSNLYTLCFIEENKEELNKKSENKEEGESKAVIQDTIPQGPIAGPERMRIQNVMGSELNYIPSFRRWSYCWWITILSKSFYALSWPGEEVSLIPP